MLSNVLRRSPTLLRWSVVLAAGLVVLYLAVLAVFNQQPDTRLALGNLILVLGGLLAATALGYAARSAGLDQPRVRQAWALLALAQLFTTLGDLVWAVAELSRQDIPILADALYLAYYPLFVLAIVLLPTVPITRTERVRLLLDMAIMLLGAGLVLWAF